MWTTNNKKKKEAGISGLYLLILAVWELEAGG
jgi:hypothetical protein